MGRSPTITLLAVFAVVFVSELLIVALGGGIELFALALPIDHRPWTVLLSVYAHKNVPHLVANGVALFVLGLGVERITTSARFHVFFAVTGMLAGVTQVFVTGLFGPSVPVLGASGAIFALFGYAVTGNALARGVLRRIGRTAQFVVFAVLALAVTIATAAPGVALIAHFTGLGIGLVAGRVRILHAR